MNPTLVTVLYMVSAVLFVRGIKLLGKAATARRGNFLSAAGMLVAVVTVLFEKEVIAAGGRGYAVALSAVVLGSAVGVIWASNVKMTGMPELVALFNGFGGLSSMLVAVSQHAAGETGGAFAAATLALTVVVGAVAFTGSVVAWGKLAGNFMKKLNRVPFKNAVNAALCALALAASAVYAASAGRCSGTSAAALAAVSALSLLLGFTLVVPVGGGDMPVVISLLNAFSGLAAAFAGFAIGNVVLVVAGCLVGASGFILTLVMCKAMNKGMGKLLFAPDRKGGRAKGAAAGPEREPRAMSVEDAYAVLEAARSVAIVPGYGMAVAQAQHAVKELADKLEANGAEVFYAIHPVAGRMPGHMNVLLAEANVPYEQLKTADEANPLLPTTDVAVVIGANDVVNPAAIDDPSSPIHGMPIVNAFEARTVFVFKRGRGTGFSGLENPLFTRENTVMVYGDAKQTCTALAAEFAE
ncbi:MAG: NAD(P)(+) transhydrogenase (Re/Si-specific) subunit beta [Kiritimatiellae bacterium]|nr:NAD(P)(+) transhydrogenase (Re/Si-specific) subunit beta [Kiritimatiellia bacterium]